MRLRALPFDLAVARLEPADLVPAWAAVGAFHSVTRTETELSVVCAAAAVPPGIRQEGPFRAFAVEGPLDFALTGLLSALLGPLAEARISVFALSTFDTDFVLVKADRFAAATAILKAAGHEILAP